MPGADFIFSFIKTFAKTQLHPARSRPVVMGELLGAYAALLVRTCHAAAHAMGGMAAQIRSRMTRSE